MSVRPEYLCKNITSKHRFAKWIAQRTAAKDGVGMLFILERQRPNSNSTIDVMNAGEYITNIANLDGHVEDSFELLALLNLLY